MTLEWPRYEAATFTAWDSVPDQAREALVAAGLPTHLFGRRYMTLMEPVLLEGPEGRPLVRFGQTMLFGGIYLDLSNGHVLELIEPPGRQAQIVRMVNTTLEQFVIAVKTVIDMFPFYNGDSELEERMHVAAKISDVLAQIDPAALDPDGFWGTFVDDLVSGDFATEDVVDANAG